jgi:hypothetical protein
MVTSVRTAVALLKMTIRLRCRSSEDATSAMPSRSSTPPTAVADKTWPKPQALAIVSRVFWSALRVRAPTPLREQPNRTDPSPLEKSQLTRSSFPARRLTARPACGTPGATLATTLSRA